MPNLKIGTVKLYMTRLSIAVLVIMATIAFSTSIIYAQSANIWNIQRNTNNNDLDFYLTSNGVSGSSLRLNSNGNARVRSLYDLDDLTNTYYLDPNASSNVKNFAAERIGIGVASPTRKLEVNGDVLFPRIYDYNNNSYYLDPDLTSQFNQINSQWITNTGNISNPTGTVGIGTAAGTTKLTTFTNTDISALSAVQQKNDGGTSNVVSISDDRGYNGVNSGNTLYVQSWSTPAGGADTGSIAHFTTCCALVSRLWIGLNGNIGIGTSAPNSKLDIRQGSDNVNGGYLTYNTAGSSYTGIFTGANGYSYFVNSGGNFFLDSNGWLHAKNPVYTDASDIRLKHNIQVISNPLSKIGQIRGVSFEYNLLDNNGKKLPAGPHVGVIAQEIEKVLPEVVTTEDDGYKFVDYSKITPLLIEAIKQQQTQIEELRAEVNRLKNP